MREIHPVDPDAPGWDGGPLAMWTWLPGAAPGADPVSQAEPWPVAGSDAAPVAVLVHGLGSSWRTWRQVGSSLAANGWQVVAVDLPGHGDSPRVHGLAGLNVIADALALTLPARPVDLLVGHSLGALTVMALLGRRPDTAHRIVLEDPPASDGGDWSASATRLERDLARLRVDRDVFRAQLLAADERLTVLEADDQLDTLARLDRAAVTDAFRRTPEFDLVELARALPPVPALLMLGRVEQGSTLPVAARLPLVSALAHGWVEVLDCGHRVHRTEFNSFMRRLDAWLDRVGAPSPRIQTGNPGD